MEIKNINLIPEPVVQQNGPKQRPIPGKPGKAADSFQEILYREQVGADKQIKVSAHAQRRLDERNIVLDRQDWAKINNAVNKAETKGANNSLLIHGELALIVSVKNRTVISAVDEQSMHEHVFTNIDSAVIVK